MCKLFAVTNASKLKTSELEKMTRSVAKNMSSERDGFGVMLKKQNGELVTRRFLKPSQATLKMPPKAYPFSKQRINGQGEMTQFCKAASVAFHGRTSTNSVGLINTHPISKHGMHLIHNGVVEDHGPKYQMLTSNDTEHMVERIHDGTFEQVITGYYATIHYKDGDNMMRIIKDSTAMLYFVWSDQLDSFVFGTTESLITSVMKDMGFKHEPIQELQDNISLEFLGNKVMAQRTITPKGRSAYADSKSELSLGYSIDSKAPAYRETAYDSALRNTLTDEELEFLEEIETLADHTWTFFCGKDSFTLDEFLDLADDEKLSCTVIRADGTILSMDDRFNGKLFDSAVWR